MLSLQAAGRRPDNNLTKIRGQMTQMKMPLLGHRSESAGLGLQPYWSSRTRSACSARKASWPWALCHLPVIGADARGANRLAKSRTVSAGNSQSELMPTKLNCARMRPKGLLRRTAAAQRIPCVHGAQNRQVCVGIESVDEALALVGPGSRQCRTARQSSPPPFSSSAHGSSPLRLGLRPNRSSSSGADL